MNFNKALICLLFFLLMIPLSIHAQKKKKENKNDAFTRSRKTLEPLPFHFSGLGSLNFYGVKFGVDYPLKMVEMRGFMGSLQGQKVTYEQYLSADAGLWHYDGIHENTFFTTEWTLRVINNRGYFWQITPLGVGVNYVIKPFLTNKITQDSFPPHNKFYVTPSVSFGIGRDFAFNRANRAKPIVVYLKGGIAGMYPFKKWFYIFPTAELGLAYRFSSINVFVKKVRRD
jgi:hypothetical protein